jgi:hypothetical protein
MHILVDVQYYIDTKLKTGLEHGAFIVRTKLKTSLEHNTCITLNSITASGEGYG